MNISNISLGPFCIAWRVTHTNINNRYGCCTLSNQSASWCRKDICGTLLVNLSKLYWWLCSSCAFAAAIPIMLQPLWGLGLEILPRLPSFCALNSSLTVDSKLNGPFMQGIIIFFVVSFLCFWANNQMDGKITRSLIMGDSTYCYFYLPPPPHPNVYTLLSEHSLHFLFVHQCSFFPRNASFRT